MREIKRNIFDAEYAISKNLIELSRKDLCDLAAEICRQVKNESGTQSYHGGLYPENISRSPDGRIAIGPGRKSDWSENELDYLAPEIYWNNQPGPESDVYSIGLILYLGASAGKLPFEGDSNNARLMRMSGKTIYAPAAAGTQLGRIIEKCLRFKSGERYHSVEELAILLDYCEDNRLLNRQQEAEALFQKDEKELTEIERIMLEIVKGNVDEASDEAENRNESSEPVSKSDGYQTEDEIFSAAGLKRPHPEKPNRMESALEEYFGIDEPDPVDIDDLLAEEEIRLYEPGKKQDIPILTEESEPELEPVTLKKKSAAKPVRNAQRITQERQMQEEDPQQKRRPFLVLLLLLAVLVIAAVVAKILITAFSGTVNERPPVDPSTLTPAVAENTDSSLQSPVETFDVSAILSEEQIQYQQEQERAQAEATPEPIPTEGPHSYEAIRADVGWLQARDDAASRGGYLVTINNEEELLTVISMAEQAGFDRIWIGAHRDNGQIVWESGEDVEFYRWDEGEPSYTDSGDGAAEDYVMLWQRNGQWVYNDSRENPLTDFYGMYGGRTGYIVEKVG